MRLWTELGCPPINRLNCNELLELYIRASWHKIPGLPNEVQNNLAAFIAKERCFAGDLLEAERARAAVNEWSNLTPGQKEALRLEVNTLTYGRRTQVFVDTVVLVRYIWQLAEMSDAKILARAACAGRKAASGEWMLNQIQEALKRRGLETGMKIPDDVKGASQT